MTRHIVIPGRTEGAGPESMRPIHAPDSGYGFQARRYAASRNDEENLFPLTFPVAPMGYEQRKITTKVIPARKSSLILPALGSLRGVI
jgi:hypothetical protein